VPRHHLAASSAYDRPYFVTESALHGVEYITERDNSKANSSYTLKHRMKRWGGGDLPLFADPMPEDPDLARRVDLWREPEDGA
jgi:hypothetical protein